ncbi:hypothetical protein AOLI_G00277690 [Acnodon oligacanthus]
MSLASCVAYLRMDKNKKATVKAVLDSVGVSPRPVTTLTSMCSKLTEGEAADLSQSLGHLVATHVPFNKVKLLEERDTNVALGHLALFKEMMTTVRESIKAEAGMFNLATHGLGFSLLDVFEKLFTRCADAQIAALKGVCDERQTESSETVLQNILQLMDNSLTDMITKNTLELWK